MPTIPVMAFTIEIGDAIPDLAAASPKLKSGIANLANTPPPTNLTTQPDFTNKNTGRTQTATQVALSKMSGIS